jgi:hypothetical protein
MIHPRKDRFSLGLRTYDGYKKAEINRLLYKQKKAPTDWQMLLDDLVGLSRTKLVS